MRTIGLVLVCAMGFASSLGGCGDDDVPPLDPDGSVDAGYAGWTLETLTPEQGFYVRTPEFPVGAGEEIQDCYFLQVPDLAGDGADLWVDRTVTAINPGSHHTNVFRVTTIHALDPADGVDIDLGGVQGKLIKGSENIECWKSPNWADWPLVANSQNSSVDNPYTDWQLPDNVASRFTPGETLMLQIHYVNASTQVTPFAGKVGVNFYRSSDTNPQELGTLFATQQSIRVCQSDPTPSYHGVCNMPEGNFTVVAANGHFHSRGKQFGIFSWDGISDTEPPASSKFYTSDSWDEPPMELDLNLVLPANGGIWWTCDFQWQEPEAPTTCADVNAADAQMADDCCYTFGGKVEKNEHCNVFLYYYPKAPTGGISCN
jgi:hypothetical protein